MLNYFKKAMAKKEVGFNLFLTIFYMIIWLDPTNQISPFQF